MAIPKGANPRKERMTERRRDILFSYAMLGPALAVFCLVILYPIAKGILMSFCDYTFFNMSKAPAWNDFGNYRLIFENGEFWTELKNTLVFSGGTILMELALGMAVALALSSTLIKRPNIWRSLVLMPWTMPSIVTALLFVWIFQAQYGIFNYMAYGLGLLSERNAEWIQNPATAMGTVMIAVVWKQTPYMIVMILAGLQSVRSDLLEAAAIDGAGSVSIFLHVKLPSISAVLGTTLITSLMAAFQQYTIIYNMTNGGPLNRTTTLSIGAYKMAFTNYNLGAGSAIGVLWMFLIGTVVTVFNIKSRRFDG